MYIFVGNRHKLSAIDFAAGRVLIQFCSITNATVATTCCRVWVIYASQSENIALRIIIGIIDPIGD